MNQTHRNNAWNIKQNNNNLSSPNKKRRKPKARNNGTNNVANTIQHSHTQNAPKIIPPQSSSSPTNKLKLSYASRISSAAKNNSIIPKKKSLMIRNANALSIQKSKNSKINLHGNLSTKELLKIRMKQRDICYVAGLPKNVCTKSILSSKAWFGRFGKIKDVTITDNENCIRTNWMCVHIKYYEDISAAKAVKAINHKRLDDGRVLEANYGTQRYCEFFINHKKCHKLNCPFRHSYCALSEIVHFNDNCRVISDEEHAKNQQQNQNQNQSPSKNQTNHIPAEKVVKSNMIRPAAIQKIPQMAQIQAEEIQNTQNQNQQMMPVQNSQKMQNLVVSAPEAKSEEIKIRPQVIKNVNVNVSSSSNVLSPTHVTHNGHNINDHQQHTHTATHSVASTGSSTDLKENKYEHSEDRINGCFNDHLLMNDDESYNNAYDQHMEDTYIVSQSAATKSIENFDDSLLFNQQQQRQIHDLYEQNERLKRENNDLYQQNERNLAIIQKMNENYAKKEAEILKMREIYHRLAENQRNTLSENERLREENRMLNLKLQQMEIYKNNHLRQQQQQQQQIEGHMRYEKNLDFIDYALWGWQDVYQWIMRIESGKFRIYAKELQRHLKQENIDGSCIKSVSTNDLHRFGIIDFKDKQLILEQIANLKSNLGLDNLILNDALFPNLI